MSEAQANSTQQESAIIDNNTDDLEAEDELFSCNFNESDLLHYSHFKDGDLFMQNAGEDLENSQNAGEDLENSQNASEDVDATQCAEGDEI